MILPTQAFLEDIEDEEDGVEEGKTLDSQDSRPYTPM